MSLPVTWRRRAATGSGAAGTGGRTESSPRHRVSLAVCARLARNPKWRIRTKRPERTWREIGSGTRSSLTQGIESWQSPPGLTRTTFSIPLRVPVGLRQGVRGPRLVLLGDFGVDRSGLDAGVAELLLDNFKVAPAGPPDGSASRPQTWETCPQTCPRAPRTCPNPPYTSQDEKGKPLGNIEFSEGSYATTALRRQMLYPLSYRRNLTE
jgi:hypothetical protein